MRMTESEALTLVISGGEFDLDNILDIIQMYHLQGKITADEAEYFESEAKANAPALLPSTDFDSSRLNDLESRVTDMETFVGILKGEVTSLETDESSSEDEE